LWAKGLNAKHILKKMCPVYGGKYLSLKWFILGGKRFADDGEVETEVRKWLRQQSKDLYTAGFDALVKQGTIVSMLYQYGEINAIFQVRIPRVLLFISICDVFTDSPSYVKAKLIMHLINYAPRHEDVRESACIAPPLLSSERDGDE
jgi:hypothetical protein